MMMCCDGCRRLVDMAEEKYLTEWIAGDTRILHNENCKQLFLERIKNEQKKRD